MTTDPRSALELRRAIAEVYLRRDPPPGMFRASTIYICLHRVPDSAEYRARARDLVDAATLYRRLTDELVLARARYDVLTALVIHGLLGHATAALLGSTDNPGWRAAALDLLRPDGAERKPLDDALAARLLALATADDDEPEAGS